MKLVALLALVFCSLLISVSATDAAETSFYDFSLKSIGGQPAPLAAYKGNVVLVVNVASQCGFTPQYAELEKLYRSRKDRGLVIVGVPANNFGGQEPGSDAEIQQFCSRTYNVTFPMTSKVSVKGADQTPLYVWLTAGKLNNRTAGDVKWNFTKFLIDRQGKVAERFESAVEPGSPELVGAIDRELGK